MAHRVHRMAHRGAGGASERRATGPLQLLRRLPRPSPDGAAEGVAGGEAEAAGHVPFPLVRLRAANVDGYVFRRRTDMVTDATIAKDLVVCGRARAGDRRCGLPRLAQRTARPPRGLSRNRTRDTGIFRPQVTVTKAAASLGATEATRSGVGWSIPARIFVLHARAQHHGEVPGPVWVRFKANHLGSVPR